MDETNLEIVRVYEWLNWLSGTLHGQAFGGLLRPCRFSDEPDTYASLKAKGLKSVQECFDMIESDLVSVHAVGSGFTAVDAFLYVFYCWGALRELDMKGKHPKFTNLVGNLRNRQSVQAALQVEGVNPYVPYYEC